MRQLPNFTFSHSLGKLLRPISKGTKRIGLLKVAPRVQGKIIETEVGTRYLIVEQQGRNVWRGRCRSITEAVDKNEAGIGVDKTLVDRAVDHGVTVIMVTIEEQRRIFLAPINMFNDPTLTKTRANYQGRATRILGYENYISRYLGPNLKKVRKHG